MLYNGKVIAKMNSKKGSTLVSCFRSSDRLVDNCVLSNPLNLEVNVNDNVKGEMVFNNGGLNTLILTEIIESK